jgi:hypothetical protein
MEGVESEGEDHRWESRRLLQHTRRWQRRRVSAMSVGTTATADPSYTRGTRLVSLSLSLSLFLSLFFSKTAFDLLTN